MASFEVKSLRRGAVVRLCYIGSISFALCRFDVEQSGKHDGKKARRLLALRMLGAL
jgi:hypothetical protein